MKAPAILRFAGVGVIATVTHLTVGVLLVTLGLSPTGANVAAFLLAFLVSFLGHWQYTFGNKRLTAGSSFARFCISAPFCLGIGHLQLVLLMKHTAFSHEICLATSVVTTAALSFACHSKWTFQSASAGRDRNKLESR